MPLGSVNPIERDDLIFEPSQGYVVYRNQRIDLSPRPFEVLRCIHTGLPNLVSVEELLRSVWHTSDEDRKNLAQKQVSLLNKKLRGFGFCVHGVPNFGYLLARVDNSSIDPLRDGKAPMSRQIIDSRTQQRTNLELEHRSLPSELEDRIDALQLPSPVAGAVRRVLGAEKFPLIMTLSGDVVFNPIWERIPPDDRQRLAAEFSPFGSMLRRFIDIDVFLLRAEDANGNPYLLHYFSGKPKSGWQAYLFPFRYKSPGESEQVRQAENARILAGYFLMPPSDFSTESLGDQFVVSIKPDVGYSLELVTYVFKFCSVTMRTAPEWLSCIEPQLKNGQSVQKFRWVHAGELELDDRSVLVNADVLRGIHQFFGTSISSVPVGFPVVLRTGN